MELNDKAAPPDTSPGQPVNDTEDMLEQSVPSGTNVTERHVGEGEADDASVESGKTVGAGEAAEAVETATATGGREHIRTAETPFDRQPVKPDRIDWAGIGIAFFGGVGGNFFLALFVFFLQQMLGAVVYGPGVLAILSGLFVVMQLLVPFSIEVRRMTISFWIGLLSGYVLIAVLMNSFFAAMPG